MVKLKSNKVTRDKMVSIRLSPNEKNFLDEFAKKENISLRTFIRDCAIDFAIRSVEDGEVMDSIKPGNKMLAKETFHKVFDEFQESFLKSWEGIDERLLKLEKFMESFAYSYFYHTKEVNVKDRDKADVSANERLDIVTKMSLESMNEE